MWLQRVGHDWATEVTFRDKWAHLGRGRRWVLATTMCACSVMSDFLWSYGMQPVRLLCPWDFPGRDTRVGCQFLLQRIFPTQGSSPHLLLWQEDSLPLSHLGSPLDITEELLLMLLDLVVKIGKSPDFLEMRNPYLREKCHVIRTLKYLSKSNKWNKLATFCCTHWPPKQRDVEIPIRERTTILQTSLELVYHVYFSYTVETIFLLYSLKEIKHFTFRY